MVELCRSFLFCGVGPKYRFFCLSSGTASQAYRRDSTTAKTLGLFQPQTFWEKLHERMQNGDLAESNKQLQKDCAVTALDCSTVRDNLRRAVHQYLISDSSFSCGCNEPHFLEFGKSKIVFHGFWDW